MTGIRGAGYPGTAAGGRGLFDPLNQAARGTGSPGKTIESFSDLNENISI